MARGNIQRGSTWKVRNVRRYDKLNLVKSFLLTLTEILSATRRVRAKNELLRSRGILVTVRFRAALAIIFPSVPRAITRLSTGKGEG